MAYEDDIVKAVQRLMKSKAKNIIFAVLGFLVFILILNPLVMIGAGERGIILNFGAVSDDILNEGIHFRVPIMQKIIKMDVKIQKAQTDSDASTKDLQDTKFSIVINYHILPNEVNWIYQNIGIHFKERIIDPAVQEVVKAVSAKYTAEELITQRDKVSKSIKELLKTKLDNYKISVDNFSIVNFSFSQQFTQAIEEKQTAEQKALKALRDLDRIKIEAQQKIEQARADAMELQLKRVQVTDKLIKLREIEAQMMAIEKWDGNLPRVTSGAMPFLNVDSIKK